MTLISLQAWENGQAETLGGAGQCTTSAGKKKNNKTFFNEFLVVLQLWCY